MSKKLSVPQNVQLFFSFHKLGWSMDETILLQKSDGDRGAKSIINTDGIHGGNHLLLQWWITYALITKRRPSLQVMLLFHIHKEIRILYLKASKVRCDPHLLEILQQWMYVHCLQDVNDTFYMTNNTMVTICSLLPSSMHTQQWNLLTQWPQFMPSVSLHTYTYTHPFSLLWKKNELNKQFHPWCK